MITNRILLASVFLLAACVSSADKPGTPPGIVGASSVEIVSDQGRYHLLVNGEPFVVKGVGLSYSGGERMRALKAAGGNSFRTWHADKLDRELALAKSLGLMVAVGLDTGKELQGFDYNDERKVLEQYKRITAYIDRYKNHPNVLCWVIANEPNLLFDEEGKLKDVNPKVYDALADIVDYIHETDPNHPVTFALAGASKKHIDMTLERVPQIDFVSVQVYGDLAILGDTLESLKLDKPFMVTEFGPKGHWEVPATSWGREIEEPSGPKAAGMASRMEANIVHDKTGKIIGSFAFLWGQKQERTPTWYGMFNENGEQTARIDELTRIWTGSYPDNRAPLTDSITLNGKRPRDSVTLQAGKDSIARLVVSDPDGDVLTTDWRIMQEVETRSQGGHFEAKPKSLPVNVSKVTRGKTTDNKGFVEIEFKAPVQLGEYRLFSYSVDGHQHVANANIPFKVIN